jgi:hypothetical protein
MWYPAARISRNRNEAQLCAFAVSAFDLGAFGVSAFRLLIRVSFHRLFVAFTSGLAQWA